MKLKLLVFLSAFALVLSSNAFAQGRPGGRPGGGVKARASHGGANRGGQKAMHQKRSGADQGKNRIQSRQGNRGGPGEMQAQRRGPGKPGGHDKAQAMRHHRGGPDGEGKVQGRRSDHVQRAQRLQGHNPGEMGDRGARHERMKDRKMKHREMMENKRERMRDMQGEKGHPPMGQFAGQGYDGVSGDNYDDGGSYDDAGYSDHGLSQGDGGLRDLAEQERARHQKAMEDLRAQRKQLMQDRQAQRQQMRQNQKASHDQRMDKRRAANQGKLDLKGGQARQFDRPGMGQDRRGPGQHKGVNDQRGNRRGPQGGVKAHNGRSGGQMKSTQRGQRPSAGRQGGGGKRRP